MHPAILEHMYEPSGDWEGWPGDGPGEPDGSSESGEMGVEWVPAEAGSFEQWAYEGWLQERVSQPGSTDRAFVIVSR